MKKERMKYECATTGERERERERETERENISNGVKFSR